MMITARLIVSLLLAAYSLVLTLPASATLARHTNMAELKQKLTEILAEKQGAGLAIGVVSESGPVWQAGIGLADREQGVAVTPTTLFQVASVSKIVIGLACGLLVEEYPNKISWQTPVRQLIPDLPIINPWQKNFPVKFIHLLEHTSGAQEVIVPWISPYTYPSAENVLTTLIKPVPLIRPPGDYVTYSNLNYITAAAVIEKVSGESFDHYIKSRIFDPLGMRYSTFRLQDIDKIEQLEHGETPITLAKRYTAGKLLRDPPTEGAYRYAAGMISNVVDLSKFMNMLLHDGRYQGRALFSPELIVNLERPQSSLPARGGLQPLGHGPGAVLRQSGGRVFAGHNGITDGFQASMYYDRKFKYGLIILQNNHSLPDAPSLSAIRRELIQAFLPEVRYQKQDVLTFNKEKFDRWQGFYQIANPRFAKTGVFQRLQSALFLETTTEGLTANYLFGREQQLEQVGEATFKHPGQIYATAYLGRNSLGTRYFHTLSNDFYEPASFAVFLTQILWLALGVIFLLAGVAGLLAQVVHPALRRSLQAVSAHTRWSNFMTLGCFISLVLVLTAINTSYKATSLNLYSGILLGTTLTLPMLCLWSLTATAQDLKRSRLFFFSPLTLVSGGLSAITAFLVYAGWFAVAFWR